MSEQYGSFEELSREGVAGLPFEIEIQDRGTDFVIVGIHGGQIEPGTEEVVRAIAGSDISYYLFLGTDRSQHITSHNFDEPSCIALLARCKEAISIHGKAGPGEFVMLGGLDADLISKTKSALQGHGFTVDETSPSVAGTQPTNICNRGSSRMGLQIEMSRELRDLLIANPERMWEFAHTIRALVQY